MAPWDDPKELGRRIRAARAYANENRIQFAPRLSTSDRTLAKMENGDTASLGKTSAARKALAQQAVEAGAPPEFFGLDELQGVTRIELDALLRGLESNSADPPEAPDEAGDG